MGGLRWTAAGCLLISILKIRGEPLPAGARGRPWRCWASCSSGAATGAWWAEQSVPSGLTAVLVSTTPFWMVGVEQLMPDGERFTLRHVVGLLIGFCGIVLVWPEIRVERLARLFRRCSGDATGVRRLGRGFGGAPAGGAKTKTSSRAWPFQMVAAGVLVGSWPGHRRMGQSPIQRADVNGASLFTVDGVDRGFSGARARAQAPAHRDGLALRAHQLVIAVLLGTVVLREPFSARIAACAVVLAGTAIVRSTESRANVSAPATPRAGPRPASRGRG